MLKVETLITIDECIPRASRDDACESLDSSQLATYSPRKQG